MKKEITKLLFLKNVNLLLRMLDYQFDFTKSVWALPLERAGVKHKQALKGLVTVDEWLNFLQVQFLCLILSFNYKRYFKVVLNKKVFFINVWLSGSKNNYTNYFLFISAEDCFVPL